MAGAGGAGAGGSVAGWAGASGAGDWHSATILIRHSMGVQQPLGLLAAPLHNAMDDAVDQLCCMSLKAVLQSVDHELPIQTADAEAVQDVSLCSLCQPPLGPKYLCQVVAQPGQHRIQEMLLSLEKFRPDLGQEATHSLCPRSSPLSWGRHPLRRRWRGRHGARGAVFRQAVGSSTCLAAGIWQLVEGCDCTL